MMGNLSTRAGVAAAATGGAVGGGLIGGALGGAAGGAVGYGANYAGQKVIMQNDDVEWDGNALFKATWQGALTGSVGAAAGSIANGATGAMLGGFASGVVGSWATGDEGWDILQGGLLGAGMGLISYAASVHVVADKDYSANERARAAVADEMGVKVMALDDLYAKQSTTTDPTQEYYINENSTKAEIVPMETSIEADGTERIVGHMPTAKVLVHGHGEGADFSSTGTIGSGPSGIDILSAAKFPDQRFWVLDATNGQIHNYNGHGVEGLSSYSADIIAGRRTNITQTLEYVQKVTYKEYYGKSWSW